MKNETVFAPATPAGGAIAIIRITGEKTYDALKSVFHTKKPIIAREMMFGRLKDGDRTVDEAMACFYRAPASYTGEDMAELFVHGGRAVLRRALDMLDREGLRPAQPGEFTKRAFLNGKLSLSSAEAVMDMVNASTQRARASALEQLEGSVGKSLSALEDELIDIIAGIDAALDYPDELEEDVLTALPSRVASLQKKTASLAESGENARFIREGATVAILGAPNAGKSSLFNALLGTSRAIVTELPGTTRDMLEESASFEGIPVRLIDTAGIREACDEAERQGVARSREVARGSDALILAFDAAKPLEENDVALIERTQGTRRVACLCKGDLTSAITPDDAAFEGIETLCVSAATGEGLDLLRARIAALLVPDGETALITNSRHVALLREASETLARFDVEDGADCVAVLLHSALSAIGEITGKSVSDTVIERIFERFCVGK